MPRRVAFSHKQKKQQLKERRARRQEHPLLDQDVDEARERLTERKKEKKGRGSSDQKVDKLRSVFEKEPKEVIKERIDETRRPYHSLPPEEGLEIEIDTLYGEGKSLDFPKRPAWSHEMTKEEVIRNEENYFKRWLRSVYDRYPVESLGYFEHNLEVWRQLWRVVEMSDIVLVIVDIRHPVIHFPPSLYNYVVNEMKRSMVLVFNKADLVEPDVVEAWREYFKSRFPKLHTAVFSCYTRAADASSQQAAGKPLRGAFRAVGVRDLLEACKEVVLHKEGVQVDWRQIIAQYSREQEAQASSHETEEGSENSDDEEHEHDSADDAASSSGSDLESEEDDEEDEEPRKSSEKELTDEESHDEAPKEDESKPHHKFITIGLIGHPNVGKSSIINGILGRKVVSASKTPGHTKHFQTIHLTANVRLSDSPGLVFPSLVPRKLQILSGIFNIAQVNEPYSVIQYLAERIDLPKILDLTHPDIDKEASKEFAEEGEQSDLPWTAWAVCEAYAIKRGFMTSKNGFPDAYRAANNILRMAFDGRVLLSFKPPGYHKKKQQQQQGLSVAVEEKESR